MNLRPYQVAALDAIRDKYAQGTRRVLLRLATGAGKCHARGTPILLHDGSTKRVEDVKPGDALMGPDSTPRRVLSTCSGTEPMYQIIPTKGESWGCNESHILSLVNTTTGCVTNLSVRDYLEKSPTFKHTHKLYRTGVSWDEMPTTFEPYAVGIYAAEGSRYHPVITNPDPEIISWCYAWAARHGMSIRDEAGRGCRELHFRSEVQGWHANHADALRKTLNVGETKRIPREYLINSDTVRLQVLAGLLDGDGYLHNGGFEITTKWDGMRNDILFLARSLGFAAYSTIKRATIKSIGFVGVYHRITIAGDTERIPTKISRKQAAPRRQIKGVLRTGFKVEPVGNDEYFGFEIDGDHLYLLGDFTVTHNTVIFCQVLAGVQARGKRALMVVRGRELVDQASRRLFRENIDHGCLMSGHWNVNPAAAVQLASIDTLFRRKYAPPADIIVIDEAHLAASDSFRWLFGQYPEAYYLPVTATAYVKKGLRHIADDIVSPISFAELIAQGYLAQPRYYAPTKLDLDGVRTDSKTGDYVAADVAAVMDKAAIYGDVVENYRQKLAGAPAVLFAIDVKHSILIRDRFRSAGIRAEHVEANTPDSERKRIMADLETGACQVVSNVGILTTGVDMPNIRGVILCRATKSLNLYIQMVGRGTRIVPGKTEFIVLDHANNVATHGFVENEPPVDLDGVKPRESEVKPIQCSACFGCFYREQGSICPYCGHCNAAARQAGERDKSEDANTELKEITSTVDLGAIKREREVSALIATAIERGYQGGWVFYKLKEKYGDHAARKIWNGIKGKLR